VAKIAINLLLAPLQKHLLGCCTIDMLPLAGGTVCFMLYLVTTETWSRAVLQNATESSHVVTVNRRWCNMSTRKLASAGRRIRVVLSCRATGIHRPCWETASGQPSTSYHFSCISISPVRRQHLPVCYRMLGQLGISMQMSMSISIKIF